MFEVNVKNVMEGRREERDQLGFGVQFLFLFLSNILDLQCVGGMCPHYNSSVTERDSTIWSQLWGGSLEA